MFSSFFLYSLFFLFLLFYYLYNHLFFLSQPYALMSQSKPPATSIQQWKETIDPETLEDMKRLYKWNEDEFHFFERQMAELKKEYEDAIREFQRRIERRFQAALAVGLKVQDGVIFSASLDIVRQRHPGQLPEDDALAIALIQ